MPKQESVEVINTSINDLRAVNRDEIDMQVTTAKRYPRDIRAVRDEILALVTMDEEVAEECFYAKPKYKDGDIEFIMGPSVRLAEIALASYGNVRARQYTVAIEEGRVVAEAEVADLQKNFAVRGQATMSILKRDGKRYSEDMINTICQAAQSVAFRNACFKVIPGALIQSAYKAARETAIGTTKSLPDRRERMLARFTKLNVSDKKIERFLGVKSTDEIGLEQLEKMFGVFTAIKSGEARPDEIFRPGMTSDKFQIEKPATTTKSKAKEGEETA